MRKVELIPGVQSSILGFGCAPILGAVGGKAADHALHLALDSGVTHFDIARSYGYGEAEAFVGRFLSGRRDQVVLASKFGIRATWKAGLLRPLKPLVRVLKSRRTIASGTAAPATAPATAGAARDDPFHERIPLTAASMCRSLELSLAALGTDYLDLLFVHEPTAALDRIDELASAAAELKRQGKIRGWGLAFDWKSRSFLEPVLSLFDVLQFNNSPANSHYARSLEAHRDAPNIFFSPLRGTVGKPPGEVLSRMWEDFPRSVILCSMFTPAHIMANCRAAGASQDGGEIAPISSSPSCSPS